MKKVKRINNSEILRLEDEILQVANSPRSQKILEIQLPKNSLHQDSSFIMERPIRSTMSDISGRQWLYMSMKML